MQALRRPLVRLLSTAKQPRQVPRKALTPKPRASINQKAATASDSEANRKDTVSPEELKARRRKVIITGVGIYMVFVAGSYWFLTSGVANNGPYEETRVRDTTEIYDGLASDYDRIINRDEQFMLLPLWRKWITRQVQGDVLEVSCGTGRNITYLDLSKLKSITFADASPKMVEKTKDKFFQRNPNYAHAKFLISKAEALPLDGPKYDVIYETFGICSFEDPVQVLVHLQSLLKPGGKIVLIEHGRGTWEFINRILDKNAAPRAEKFGCRWNLDIGDIVRRSGLEIDYEDRSHLGTTWSIVTHRPGDIVHEEPRKRFLIW
ncbi:S-adenosyl-L-methionine-dependent methyltransferase [Dipodascopsis uninucleata]